MLVQVIKDYHPELYKYLTSLANHLNKIDSGKYDFHTHFDPSFQIRWWRLAGLNDREILRNVYFLFRGMQIAIENGKIARNYLNSYGQIERYCMIVRNPPKDGKIHKYVFKKKIPAYIYYNTRFEDMGMGAIINKYLLDQGYSCKYLKEKLPNEWVFNRNMVFWGSLKGPKDPEKSGISLDEFVRIINESIDGFNKKI